MLTITTRADSYDLIIPAEAKEIGSVGDADDTTLRHCIAAASDLVSKYCNRVFAIETLQETFRLCRRETSIVLSRYPLVELTGITENEVGMVAADYEANVKSGEIVRLTDGRPRCWPNGTVMVAYRAGFAAIPGPIKQATKLLTSRYLTSDGQQLRSEDVPGVISRTFLDHPDGGRLPAEIEALLSDYRKPAGA